MALLSFLGAIQQVTGSCYLLETHDGARVLLTCYNEALGEHLARLTEEFPTVTAGGFHSVCGRAARAAGDLRPAV